MILISVHPILTQLIIQTKMIWENGSAVHLLGSEGAKIVWAATNPDETAVYVMMDVPNPEFMQTFGLREDVKKAREEAGADVASTTVITPIKEYWLGD